ncbi:unnamed protein product, partial [Prorocentrum cordatum]
SARAAGRSAAPPSASVPYAGSPARRVRGARAQTPPAGLPPKRPSPSELRPRRLCRGGGPPASRSRRVSHAGELHEAAGRRAAERYRVHI